MSKAVWVRANLYEDIDGVPYCNIVKPMVMLDLAGMRDEIHRALDGTIWAGRAHEVTDSVEAVMRILAADRSPASKETT